MHPSIAINETAKAIALQLVDSGYTQSRQSAACPICGIKYLLLLDSDAYERNSDLHLRESAQATALKYFAEKLRETHDTGHWEEKLVMV